MLNFISSIITAIAGYLKADWYILLIGILIAVVINVYFDTDKLRNFFERKSGISIPGAVLFGSLTPLCACGTMAVLLSMFVSALPWGTVMAFLISSPLSSPSEVMYETAFFGGRFAVGILISSIVLGLLAGLTAHLLEKKTKFFENQFRFVNNRDDECSCSSSKKKEKIACCTDIMEGYKENSCVCSGQNEEAFAHDIGSENVIIKKECGCTDENTKESKEASFVKKYKLDEFLKGLYNIGVKKVLLYFVIFIALGKIAEMLIPKEWIYALFSGDKAYSIPLAATIGLPLYLNDSSALPLIRSFVNSGAGEGAAIAFIIAGKATGIPVIAGMSTFIKKRAMLFYVGFVYAGAILAGYLYQIIIR